MENVFNLAEVQAHFLQCIINDRDIDIKSYTYAFEELCRFFHYLGTVFSFVAKDVYDKLKILNHHLQTEKNKEHYQTVASMIAHETRNYDLQIKSNPPNACRTLLRLHRAMKFIALFLEKLKDSSDEKLSNIAYSSYHATIAVYHTWIVRKGVGLAVYTLPSREKLLMDFGNDRGKTLEEIDQLQNTLYKVYAIIQKLYEENKILDLP